MADDISLIQTQLWVVMGMFALLIAVNLLCAYFRRSESKEQRNKPNFGTMWDKDQLDELIALSSSHLREFPNSVDALYFGARALLAKNRYEEARPLIERFKKTQPTEMDTWQPMLDLINGREDS
mgnify:CR=1 FL=1